MYDWQGVGGVMVLRPSTSLCGARSMVWCGVVWCSVVWCVLTVYSINTHLRYWVHIFLMAVYLRNGYMLSGLFTFHRQDVPTERPSLPWPLLASPCLAHIYETFMVG